MTNSTIIARLKWLAASYLIIGISLLSAHTAQAQHAAGGMTPSALAGGAPAGSYALSGFEQINLFNGNLNFRLPLLSVGGRGSATHTISLTVEKKWETEKTGTENPEVFDWRPVEYQRPGIMPGYGPGLMQGQHIGNHNQTHVCSPGAVPTYLSTKTTLTFTAPDGTEIELLDQLHQGAFVSVPVCPTNPPSRGKVFVSKEGEAAIFVSDTDIQDEIHVGWFDPLLPFRPTGSLMMRDGTRYRIVNGLVTSIRDRNGNTLTFAYEYQLAEGPDGRVKSITDSLDRVVNITYATPTDPHDRITYNGFGGVPRTTLISYAPLSSALRTTQPTDAATPRSYAQLFPQLSLDAEAYNPQVVSSITLPDNRSYNLKYNGYGELARVVLPTGGAFEYDYGGGLNNASAGGSYERYSDIEGTYKKIYRRVVERRVYADGSALESRTTFDKPETYDTSSFNITNSGSVTVVQRDASNTPLSYQKHYFYGAASPSIHELQTYSEPDWGEGREWKTEDYNSTGTTLLRRVQHEWANAPAFGQGPRILWSETTLADTNQVSRQEFVYDQYHNQTDVYEYDFGANGTAGALLRRTHVGYLDAPAYTGNNVRLLSLPSEQWVSTDASGTNRLSLTTYEYDNYTTDGLHHELIPRTNISGLDAAFTSNYPTRGNVTSVTSYANAATQTGAVTSAVQYDVAGNPVKAIDGRGSVAQIAYSATTQYAFPTSTKSPVPDPAGQSGSGTEFVTTTGYDFWTGLVTSTTDINGIVTSYEYNDALDRPTRVVRAVGTPLSSQTSIVYDDAGRSQTATGDLNTFEDNALKSVSLYDGLGRTIETHAVEPDGTHIINKQEYDALGRISRLYNPYRSTADETYGWTTSTFDALSRVTKVETFNAGGISTGAVNSQYSGLQVTVTDQAGRQRRSVTDALGRLTGVVEDPAGLNYQTIYGYDVMGNLRTVAQGQQTRSFTYDSLSRLTAAQNPESGSVSYHYDNNGNLQQKTDARGITTGYAYDALNRVTGRSYSDGTPAVSYRYDTAGIANAKGRLTQVSSSVSVTRSAGFDELGRVTSSSQQTNGQTYSMSYEYDLAGNLRREIYPTGRVIEHGFDGAGRLTQVSGSRGTQRTTYASGILYAAQGAVRQLTLGNGLIEQSSFNSRMQPTAIKLGTAASPVEKLQLVYDYGTSANNGNVLSQIITVPGMAQALVQTYQYDALNRLSAARETYNSGVQNWQQLYTYDRYGNRSFRAGTTLPQSPDIEHDAVNNPSINPQTNRFDGGQGYAYDNSVNNSAGNLTSAPGYTYQYDAENRLVSSNYAAPNQQVTPSQYAYDGDGRRVKKVTGNGQEVSVFVYDAMGQMVCEYNNLPPTSESQTSYLTSDMLGTPRVITRTDGSVKARHDYLPFGEESQADTGGRTAGQGYVTDNISRKFTSKERDGETRLDYFTARYYSSAQGRFTSPDSYGGRTFSPQTLNLYSYVRNNPLKYIDPTGHQEESTHKKKGKKGQDEDEESINTEDTPIIIRIPSGTPAAKGTTATEQFINNYVEGIEIDRKTRLFAARVVTAYVVRGLQIAGEVCMSNPQCVGGTMEFPGFQRFSTEENFAQEILLESDVATTVNAVEIGTNLGRDIANTVPKGQFAEIARRVSALQLSQADAAAAANAAVAPLGKATSGIIKTADGLVVVGSKNMGAGMPVFIVNRAGQVSTGVADLAPTIRGVTATNVKQQ